MILTRLVRAPRCLEAQDDATGWLIKMRCTFAAVWIIGETNNMESIYEFVFLQHPAEAEQQPPRGRPSSRGQACNNGGSGSSMECNYCPPPPAPHIIMIKSSTLTIGLTELWGGLIKNLFGQFIDFVSCNSSPNWLLKLNTRVNWQRCSSGPDNFCRVSFTTTLIKIESPPLSNERVN